MWKDEEDQPFTEAVSDTICCWIVALKLNLCLVYVLKEIVLKMSNSKMFAGGNGIEVKVVIVLNLKKWKNLNQKNWTMYILEFRMKWKIELQVWCKGGFSKYLEKDNKHGVCA